MRPTPRQPGTRNQKLETRLSKTLANQLMNAESVEAFGERHGRLGRRMFAALKLEVDRLVHSDLNQASRLVDRLNRLAEWAGDEVGAAFARAAQGRLLHLRGHHAQAYECYEGAIRTLRR